MTDIILGNNYTFYAQTNSGGVPTDADSVPTYSIYEEETGTAIVTGSMALLDDAGTVGFYSEQVAATTGNGFEIDKNYCVRISAVVSSITGVTIKDLNIVPNPLTGRTLAELPQAKPPATPTSEEAIMALYMALRNKLDITATIKEVHNDAGTVIFKKSLTDDGTTYSEAEAESGP